MGFVIQRVAEASVSVEDKEIGRIQKGFLVFVGINQSDTIEIADKMVKKLVGLRIFADENGKTNLDLHAVDGQLLIISQFTLYADCRKGNRPSFTRAGEPQKAQALYEHILEQCRKEISVVKGGCFGADMKISLLNDGPFTVIFDSDEMQIQ